MGDVVYVGSCSGIFYAVGASSGDVLWTYDTSNDGPPGQFHGDVVVTDELIVVGSDGQGLGFLYALDRQSGALRWKHGFPRGIPAQVLRHGDAVFAATARGEVVAVDLDSGELRWSVVAGDQDDDAMVAVDPILAGGRLFVGWRPGFVDAYDLSTGRRVWRRDLDAPLGTSLARTPRGVAAGTADGTLVELSMDGELLASLPLATRLYGDLVPARECLLALGWSAAEGHFVSCVSPSLEEIRWIHGGLEKWSTLRPLTHGGQIVLGFDETLVAVDAEDGSATWTCPVAGTPRGLTAANELLYVGTVQGRLSVFPISRCAEAGGSLPGATK